MPSRRSVDGVSLGGCILDTNRTYSRFEEATHVRSSRTTARRSRHRPCPAASPPCWPRCSACSPGPPPPPPPRTPNRRRVRRRPSGRWGPGRWVRPCPAPSRSARSATAPKPSPRSATSGRMAPSSSSDRRRCAGRLGPLPGRRPAARPGRATSAPRSRSLLTTTDVVPLPPSDPRGAGLVAGLLPIVLGGLACAAAGTMLLRQRVWRVVTAGIFAVVGGFVLAALLQAGSARSAARSWPTRGS